jgi:hypothetical protein
LRDGFDLDRRLISHSDKVPLLDRADNQKCKGSSTKICPDGVLFLKSPEPRIREGVAGTVSRPLRRIHFAMGTHDYVMPINFPATFSQIIDQFFAGFELAAGRLIAIEIAYQANPERNVVQIIAVHVPAVDLPPPAIAYFDLAITGRGAVPDYEVIGESVSHSAHVPVVIIENPGTALSCAAVVDNNELPTTAQYRRAIDFAPDRPRKIMVSDVWTRPEPPSATRGWARRRRLVTLIANKS